MPDNAAPPVAFDPANPLMNPPALPQGAPPLDRVEKAHFLPALRWAIEQGKKAIAAIKANPAPADFTNTIEALEFAGEDLARIVPVFHCFCACQSDDELRAIEEVVDAELSRYHSDIALDEALFAQVKAAYDSCDKTTLTNEQGMLLEETYKSFVRSGALLPPENKAKVRVINEKLALTTTQFGNNLLKATEAYKKYITDETLLMGVPDRAKKLYAHLAREAGHETGFLITLEPYPIDILTHADNRALREEVHRAASTRCFKDVYDNLPLITELVKLRHERSRLLGFATHAAFVLDDRMAGSVETVREMLESNLATYKPAAEKELEAIRTLARTRDGVDPLKPWDVAYYARILKEETFKLDLETLRPYFNLERVLDGVRLHVQRLFNIDMREAPNDKYPTYHADVKVFEIFDCARGAQIGVLYADYYARPGTKRGGAWMDSFRDHHVVYGKKRVPLVANNCNFPKPTPESPTFLSLGDVETVFHEFGHALHALLAEGTYPSLSGTNVKWDFVELPSQVQERWIFEKEVLDTFAFHHETGEPMPADLVATIQAMKNFDAGMVGLTQTFYALLDMAYHAADPAQAPDPETLERSIAARATLIKREAGLMSTSFSHIFAGGYSAGYYGYKWAEVLDADVFSAFKTHGLYEKGTAQRLRRLYAAGGTRPPMELFVEMMGRKPDPTALLRLSGL